AIEAALGEDNPTDAFRPLEASIDRRVNEAEALDGLAEKIEKTAPGPDARHLKRGAENLLDDVRAHGKKARTALQVAQKKADLHARFKRLADEAYGLCAAREADLDRDQGHLNRERLQATGRKKDEAERTPRKKTNRLATRLNSLYSDLNDLRPDRAQRRESWSAQRGQCEEMESGSATRTRTWLMFGRTLGGRDQTRCHHARTVRQQPAAIDDLKRDDIDGKIEAVQKLCQLGPRLAALVSVEEAGALEAQLTAATAKHGQLADRTEQCRIGLEAMAEQVSNFEQDVEALAEWLTAIEQDMADVEELPINPDELLEQTNLLSVDALVAASSQLQQLAGPPRADELYAHTAEMQKRVNQIADQVNRRAERLELADRATRGVVDELDYALEWFNDAKERVMHAEPLAIDPTYLNTQLRHQKALNEDLLDQQAKLRNTAIDCRKVARQLGSDGGQDALLLEKAEVAMQLSDEVSQLCKERTEILGQTLAHVDEIGHSFEDMNRWLDEVERDLAGQPSVTTATPSHELAKQQQHNLELSAVIAAQTPLVERFEYNVNSLAELVGPADVQALRQIYDQIVGRYNDVKNQVKSRGEAIDSILDATEAFGDRLDVFLATLEGAAESLRQPAAVSADPGLLQNRIAENEALLDSLREKEAALDAMKERANELLARAQPGDAAASEVAAKIQALDQLWGEIGRGAEMRGAFLNDALAKAHQFWAELDDCQKAIDDLKARLETLEPAIGQPERLREQQQGLTDIDGALFSDKSLHLGKAMEEAMQFHDDLSALHEFLEAAEQRLHSMGPAKNVAVEGDPTQARGAPTFPSRT
ncbi:unnamed protein product, partial [Mesorhabditis spiculigera]